MLFDPSNITPVIHVMYVSAIIYLNKLQCQLKISVLKHQLLQPCCDSCKQNNGRYIITKHHTYLYLYYCIKPNPSGKPCATHLLIARAFPGLPIGPKPLNSSILYFPVVSLNGVKRYFQVLTRRGLLISLDIYFIYFTNMTEYMLI